MLGYVAAIVSAALVAGEPADLTVNDRPSVRWQAGVDVGWLGDYDDSKLWSSGYSAGASAFWAVNAAVAVGMRFGINHWTYEAGEVVADLVPPGADLILEQSTGSAQVIEFAPFARYWREGVIGSSIGGFVQSSAELTFIKPFAITEVAYETGGGRDETARFEINESRWRPAVVIAAGPTWGLSEESWLELFPSYRAIFEDGSTRHLWAVSLGFRMRV